MVTPYTPKWKWNVGAQYEFELGSYGTLTPRFDVSHQSDTFATPLNDPTSIDPSKVKVPVDAAGIPTRRSDRISGYTVANFRLTLKAPSGWQAALEITNLTDKLYYNTLFDSSTSAGYVAGSPGLPRTFSFTVKRTF